MSDCCGFLDDDQMAAMRESATLSASPSASLLASLPLGEAPRSLLPIEVNVLFKSLSFSVPLLCLDGCLTGLCIGSSSSSMPMAFCSFLSLEKAGAFVDECNWQDRVFLEEELDRDA